jgi:hypothetical protein
MEMTTRGSTLTLSLLPGHYQCGLTFRAVDRWVEEGALIPSAPVVSPPGAAAIGPGKAVLGGPSQVDIYAKPIFGTWGWEQTISGGQFMGVALGADVLAVGLRASSAVSDSRVDVYQRNPNATPPWSLTQQLLPSFDLPPPQFGTNNTEQRFGQAIAIDGSTMVIGANRCYSGRGRAFVFEESNSVWSQTQELAPELDSQDIQDHDLGDSVAISADTIALGADGHGGLGGPNVPGAVVVFVKVNGVWTQQAFIQSHVATAGDDFGTALALEGNNLVVNNPSNTSYELWQRVSGSWVFRAAQTESGARPVGLADGVVATGAPGDSVGGLAGAGQVDLFHITASSFVASGTLAAPVPAANAGFGTALSFRARALLASSSGALNTAEGYVYHRETLWVPHLTCH